MEKTCRTCLKSAETSIHLFNGQLPEKIETITSVHLLKTDNLPTEICTECAIKINLAYNFRTMVINNDRELNLRINQKGVLNRHKDELGLNEIKSEPDLVTDEYFLMKNVCDILENSESKSMEMKTEIEDPYRNIQIDNIIPEQQEQNMVKPSVKLNIPHKISSKFRGVTGKVRLYKCTVCDFVTPYNIKYYAHKRSHLVVSKSVCNICGKTVRSDNLKKHIIIHTEPPVACKECGKFCKNSESLRSHVLIHKGIEITCEFCGQTFKFRGGYRRHVIKNHTIGASRKAKCHLCDKRFHDNTDLKKHIRSHTGERPYQCEYCKKGFSSSHALKTHIRQHTNERPYKCDHCSMAFPQKVSLKTHLKSKHSLLLDSTT